MESPIDDCIVDTTQDIIYGCQVHEMLKMSCFLNSLTTVGFDPAIFGSISMASCQISAQMLALVQKFEELLEATGASRSYEESCLAGLAMFVQNQMPHESKASF